MVVQKLPLLSINYTWYGAPEKQEPSADVISIWHCPAPVPGAYCREIEPTIVLDLTQSLEEILSNFDKDLRRVFRRAERDHLVFSVTETPAEKEINAFLDFYDAFAAWKNLRRSRFSRSMGLFRFYASSGLIWLSKVSTGDGKTLTWRAYLVTNRAVFRLGASDPHYRSSAQTAERQLVGRADRFHFWQDIQYFKEKGLPMLDFGGWYSGNTDPEMLNLNRFKEEFGGKVVKVYKCWYGITVKGKLCLRCFLLLEDLQSLKRRITQLSPLLTQHLSKKASQNLVNCGRRA
jgi:lipid II:glycine glycyltransferase (peptidoglycan interpeptide bridge formation enzyme)